MRYQDSTSIGTCIASFTDYEEARKKLYELNNWKYHEPDKKMQSQTK